MNITEMALKRQQLMLLIIFMTLFAGVFAFLNIPQAQDPGFPIRTAQVVTALPGASAERIEELVTDKIETAIQEMPELDGLSSISKYGVSIVTVDIQDKYKDLRPIWDSLRRKVESAQSELPAEAGNSVVNDEYGDVFGIVVSVVADDFTDRERKDIAEQVREEFLRIPEVGKVDLYGVKEERVYIEYDNSTLQSYGITPNYLAQYLDNKNVILSGGEWQTDTRIVNIEPSGDVETIQALKHSYVPIPNSTDVIPLSHIATIYRGYEDPPKSAVSTNGSAAISLAVSMVEGGNIVELGKDIDALLYRLDEQFPWGVSFEVIAFQPQLVESTVSNFVSNLLQAVAVVSLVMLATLGLRTGLIVASLIPITIAASLALMYVGGIGLDQVSLAALMIALGMLVDNSIVMAESIMTRMEGGEKRWDAAIQAASELKVSLLTSSLTTSAAFLPIFLAESTTGEYTAPLFMVVTITLIASWFFAITMVPLLCMLFMKVKLPNKEVAKQNKGSILEKIESRYASILQRILLARFAFLGGIGLVFALSIYGFSYVPVIFFPPSEDPTFKLEIELPVGTPISRTIAVVNEMEGYLETLTTTDGLKNWSAYIGNGGPRYVLSHTSKPASPNYSVFVLNTDSAEQIDGLMKKIDGYVFENFPNAVSMTKKVESGAAVNNPIEVRILGDDSEALLAISGQVKQQLLQMGGTKGVSDDWGLKSPTYFVHVEESIAQPLGITNADIANYLQASTSGLVISQFREGEETIPIVIKASTRTQNNIERPTSVNVLSRESESVPIAQLVKAGIEWAPSVILRRDRMKAITVASGLDIGVTPGEINRELTPWLQEQSKSWPTGYRWELGGVAETSGQANASIFEKLPIAFAIILILLVAQFNCIRKAAIILATIPLGVIGVVIGLLITDSYMGFMTLLGIISLAGIVINNAIVLIDRIDFEKEINGYPAFEAICVAAKLRMRPILLTTATTVVGMVPLWLGGGIMWEPMAISIIFGLLGATVLTLGVVPALYSVFFNVKKPS